MTWQTPQWRLRHSLERLYIGDDPVCWQGWQVTRLDRAVWQLLHPNGRTALFVKPQEKEAPTVADGVQCVVNSLLGHGGLVGAYEYKIGRPRSAGILEYDQTRLTLVGGVSVRKPKPKPPKAKRKPKPTHKQLSLFDLAA